MKIVIDDKIPFIKGVFEPYAEVLYRKGGDIRREDILDADALVIRTRTRCDASLLEGTSVRMIATATIGVDHIDEEYCSAAGIHVSNSSGCNAGGVMDYVFSALYGVASRKAIDLNGATFGVIGVGHVGSRVAAMAQKLGFNVLLCDPPRAEAEGPARFCSREYLLTHSDIVTLHVPLNQTTRAMADSEFFNAMKFGAIFINAARGELIVDEDLIEARPRLGAVVIDTWNGEPSVNTRLMEMTDIATPHIAGYSYQGKQNGTTMAVRAVARYFKIAELFEFFPQYDSILEARRLDISGMNQGQIASVFQYNYPIFTDDFLFRSSPADFERLRSEYSFRCEYYID